MSQRLIDSVLLQSKSKFSAREGREQLPVYLGLERVFVRLTAPYTPLKPSFTFSTEFYPSFQFICCFQFLNPFRILWMNQLVSCWLSFFRSIDFTLLYYFHSIKSVTPQISCFYILNHINISYMLLFLLYILYGLTLLCSVIAMSMGS